MTDTDQEREDEVLRRMLKTKPTPHKAKKNLVRDGRPPQVGIPGRPIKATR